jgi:hypothetical protein
MSAETLLIHLVSPSGTFVSRKRLGEHLVGVDVVCSDMLADAVGV